MRQCSNCTYKDEKEFRILRNGRVAKLCNRCSDVRKKYVKEHRVEINKKSRERYNMSYHERALYMANKRQSRITGTPRCRYNQYRNNAKQRGIVFELSYEQFMELWQKDCFYCGNNIPTIGIDRIDSDGSYNIENVVPCCTTCNYMKKSLKQDTFFEQCFKINNLHYKK